MQRCSFYASLKVGFSAAVSLRALTIRLEAGAKEVPRWIVKPHFIGKTFPFPSFPNAITGTTFVGRISPHVSSLFPDQINFSASFVLRAISISSDKSTDSGSM